MFEPPRKLKHITKKFQALCDAVMDLNPQPLIGNIPDDVLECAHLIFMADTAVVRQCASVPEQLTNAAPHELLNLVVAHHQKLTDYFYIRSMILDGNQANDSDDDDFKVY